MILYFYNIKINLNNMGIELGNIIKSNLINSFGKENRSTSEIKKDIKLLENRIKSIRKTHKLDELIGGEIDFNLVDVKRPLEKKFGMNI